MATNEIVLAAPAVPGEAAASKLSAAILDFVSRVPSSNRRRSPAPVEAARKLARLAAARAAAAAGTLALPPGPLGWLTVLPELVAVWKIQAQMVADIAALFGKDGVLTREQMLYCLFRHTASQAVRDLVVRVGERAVVQQASLQALQAVAHRIGFKLTERAVAKAAARWVPVVGAAGVAAYAYYDTVRVARMATELFQQEIVIGTIDADE